LSRWIAGTRTTVSAIEAASETASAIRAVVDVRCHSQAGSRSTPGSGS